MIDKLQRHTLSCGDNPEEFGTYLTVVRVSSVLRSHRILSYMADPNWDEFLFDSEKYDSCPDYRSEDCMIPNPTPPTVGWYEYDNEYGYYKVDDVIYWWELPRRYI